MQVACQKRSSGAGCKPFVFSDAETLLAGFCGAVADLSQGAVVFGHPRRLSLLAVLFLRFVFDADF